jgi:protein-S-isoprenylcysteine O-methyltransferase Ste14
MADGDAGLLVKAFAGLAWLLAVLAAALFLSAGTLRFPEAWVHLGVFAGAVIAVTTYLLRRDRELLRRRLAAGPAAERRGVQQVVQALASLCFVAVYVVSALDRRFGWTSIPLPLALAANALVALGFTVVFLVFRENSHASAVVEVSPGQRLVTSGPYRHVRHPMYAGALLLLVATPPALGSLAGLVPVAALAAVLVLRLLDEERLLLAELPGYGAYRREVRWRLVPGVW